MRIIASILILFFLPACEKKQVNEIFFDEEIKKRYAVFLKTEERKCKLDAESEADRYIDSVIDRWIKKELIDTIDFPLKPLRPDRPDNLIK